MVILFGAVGLSADVRSQSDVLITRIDVEDRSEATIDRAATEALKQVVLQQSGDCLLYTSPSPRD